MSRPTPDPDFVRGLLAYLHYWQACTAALDEPTIRALDADFPNLLQAVEMGLVPPATRSAAAQVMQQCFFWVERGGYLARWCPLLERALALLPEVEPALRFRLTLQLGQTLRLQHHLSQAIRRLEEALALAQEVATPRALAEVHLNLAQTYHERGTVPLAEAHAALAHTHLPRDAPRLTMIVWQTLGRIALAQGDDARAEAWLRQALALTDPAITLLDAAHNRTALALAVQATQPDEAIRLYQESIRQLAGTANPAPQLDALLNLGGLFFKQRRLAEAERVFRQSERLLQPLAGWSFHKGWLANNLGCVLLEQNILTEAEPYLRQSVALYREIEDPLNLANAYGNLADLLVRQVRHEEAREALHHSLALLTPFADHAQGNMWCGRYRAQLAALDDSGAKLT